MARQSPSAACRCRLECKPRVQLLFLRTGQGHELIRPLPSAPPRLEPPSPLQPLSQGLALRPPESQPTPALAWRSPSACGSQPAVGLRRILHVGSAGCSKVPYGGLSESCSCEKQRPRHALLLDDGAHTHGERHRTLTTNTTTTTTQTKHVLYILCTHTQMTTITNGWRPRHPCTLQARSRAECQTPR